MIPSAYRNDSLTQDAVAILRQSEDGSLVPHHLTFQGVINWVSKTYSYRWDEALRHLPANALAMRRDAFIRALMQERVLPSAQSKWAVDVDNPKDVAQKRVKDGL